ncbi:MAG TPA: homoserine dehydrogenase [Candidatus Faeciplasma gallinarum]|uniref:Homoserine dehydrogenase n=1 Tax=Candidatus Faeciplasma gallinarum TaxID=2840799 RepID=A0A9D1EPE5_9FIRM|nr:homoserine dehydrogenase [Candidatus Faeciplasma gallinarum]
MPGAKIAVMGFGVVGSGTVELLDKNKDIIKKHCGKDVELKYILDLRDFPDSPYRDKLTKNFEDILCDPQISVVAELMGGKTFAYDYTKRLLSAGKSVVTSNKELVAAYGAELLKVAKSHGCNYLFEASVGGGIPIIRPLHQCLAANKFERISGILNGTTNYILTKMIYDQVSFDDALKQAQELGYAEKDPTADVDGHDATRKLCILGSLAFGKHIYPEYVHCSGIRNITLDDVEYAEDAGYAIKLVGLIENTDSGLVATVCPRLVSVNNPLSSVNDVFNAIMVTGDAVGDVLFYGRGAGKFPTASAVVADIIDAIKHEGRDMITLNWEDSCDRSFIRPYKSAKVSMYVRISAENVDSLKATITGMFGYVDFIPRKHRSKNELAFITPVMQESEIDRRLGILSQSAQLKRKIRLL